MTNASAVQTRAGFILYLDRGTIRNLGVTNVNIIGGYEVGALVGWSWGGTIENSYSTGTIQGHQKVGGLVGRFTDRAGGGNILRNSYSSVTVRGTNLTTTGTPVSGTPGWSADEKKIEGFGGLIGSREAQTGGISDSYSTGLVSYLGDNEDAPISDLAEEAAIKISDRISGFANRSRGGGNSFWDTVTSGRSRSGDLDGGTPKTSEEMKNFATFADLSTSGLSAPWKIVDGWEPFDFENLSTTNIWGICSRENGGYPYLLWQYQADPCALPAPPRSGGAVAAPPVIVPETAVPPRRLQPPQQTSGFMPAVSGPVLTQGSVPAPPRVATILRGGVPLSVEQSATNATTLSIRGGAFNLEVSVEAGGGGVSGEDDAPVLAVKKGSVASFAGSGMRPGATVQIFIPLLVNDARELARAIVAPDGSFVGEAPFSVDPLEEPLPIGPRLLQLVSFDDDGNQIVLEMTVNIEQRDPSPEFNREEGNVPSLPLGVSLFTSAGMPVEVQIVAVEEQGLAVIDGDGWNMAVNVAGSAGTVKPSENGAALTLVRDETALVSGTGFMAGTRADVWLFSDPVLLGTVTIDRNGNFSGEVAIDPELVPAGSHTLQLQAVGEDGYVQAANLGVSVEDSTSGFAEPELSEEPGSLAWWLLIVLLVLALLVAWVWSRRRKR